MNHIVVWIFALLFVGNLTMACQSEGASRWSGSNSSDNLGQININPEAQIESKSKTELAENQTRQTLTEEDCVFSEAEIQSLKTEDDRYALEWRCRYLAARVKYLTGRIEEHGAGKDFPIPEMEDVAVAGMEGVNAVLAKHVERLEKIRDRFDRKNPNQP